MRSRCRLLALLLLCGLTLPSKAQGKDDALSQREVDALRDVAFEPSERIRVFIEILNSRQQRITMLQTTRRSHTDYVGDMHDALEQFGTIVDELNDNLDDFARRHRDVRKELPRLAKAAGQWSTTLEGVGDDENFKVVRRLAVDALKDTTGLTQSMGPELDAYYQAHPDAAAEEKKRRNNPHAVHTEGSPES